jgi:hypothetical protein
MVLPLIFAAIVVYIIYLAVTYWYITIPVIIIVVWYFFFYNPKDSDKKSEESNQSRRSQSSSYQNYSQSDYSNSNTYSRQSYEEKSYEEKSYSYSDNTSKKKKFGRVRMARINARLEKFQITPEDAQIIFGKNWMNKLGKPEWTFYTDVMIIGIKIEYDDNGHYRRKFGRLYSKVLQIIQIVKDENPETEQSEERFEEKYDWENFWDKFNDHKYYEPSEFTEEDILEAFEIFGLNRNSTIQQIKSKYRELALKHHPDKNKSIDSTTKMTEINKAYEIIMETIVHSTVS